MKIKLISPKMTLRPMDSEFKRRLSPSIALLVVAALTPGSDEVSIDDENIGPLSLDDRPDLVGISVNVDTAGRAYEIARHYRQRNIRVVLGGIHASAMPEEAEGYADAVCIGEAENVWREILDDARRGQLKKRYYSPAPADLKDTPMPRWDLIDQRQYLYTNILTASRGCPFRCDFCYNSSDYVHGLYRNRPIENVVAEIRQLKSRQVMFVDDNFIGDPAWTVRFLDAIEPLNLTWHAAVSVNIGHHPRLLDRMRQTGCESLFIGFESINKASVQSANKHQNRIDRYEEVVAQLHDREIMVNASMVFGFDHDYPEVFAQTLDWLVSNRIETITAHIMTPYPGTRLYKKLLAEGRIIDHDKAHYNTSHVVYQPKHMTPEQLKAGYLWLYDQFYSWANIIRRRPQSARQLKAYLLFNLVYRKYGQWFAAIASHGLMNRFGRLASRLSYNVG